MRVIYWGTYEKGRPRTRILIRGLRENGVEVIECNSDVWKGIQDKTQIRGMANKIRIAACWLLSYPRLVVRYLRLPNHDLVMVGYLGHLDVIIIWLFAKLRRKTIVWDMFLSIYDAAIVDRGLYRPSSAVAKALHAWEWLATRSADLVLLDTATHAQFIEDRYRLRKGKTSFTFVGVEPERFPPMTRTSPHDRDVENRRVLFYGQFIPGHGIDTIVEAAKQASELGILWILAGTGQEERRIDELLEKYGLTNVERIHWIPFEELADWIHGADVCLGHFGESEKVSRVIPNKVFEILHAGAPLITRDTPAIRELIDHDRPEIKLVEPGDPTALLDAVLHLMETSKDRGRQILHRDIARRIIPRAIGESLVETLTAIAEVSRGKYGLA